MEKQTWMWTPLDMRIGVDEGLDIELQESASHVTRNNLLNKRRLNEDAAPEREASDAAYLPCEQSKDTQLSTSSSWGKQRASPRVVWTHVHIENPPEVLER